MDSEKRQLSTLVIAILLKNMKQSLNFTNEELNTFKNLIEKNSISLNSPLQCYLHNLEALSLLEQRKKLRINFFKKIQTLFPSHTLNEEHKQSILTPGAVPLLSFATVSLSHSHNIGGFVISSNTNFSLGFDLEYSLRVKKETVAYISKEQELQQAPSLCALWSAKEAAFKSLHKTQLHSYIKKIFISNWIHQAPDIYKYKFDIKDQGLKGRGCIIFFKTLVAGIAQIKN